MKVILLEDVNKLGRKGESVEVKDGFARNYLIPARLAEEATEANLESLKLRDKKESRLIKQQKLKDEETAKELSKVSITIPAKAKNEEELFGSVNNKMISEALQAENHQVFPEKIILPEPIKRLGIYNVKVKVSSEVETEIKLWVVKE